MHLVKKDGTTENSVAPQLKHNGCQAKKGNARQQNLKPNRLTRDMKSEEDSEKTNRRDLENSDAS